MHGSPDHCSTATRRDGAGSLESVEGMRSLDEFATAKLDELDRQSLRRELVDTTRVTGISAARNGRRLLSFCCNDYLNLTHHPAPSRRPRSRRSRVYGVGAGASRLVTGNHPLYAELEAAARAAARAPRRPACSAPAISPTPASSRRWSGRDDLIADRRTVACLPVGRRAAVARDRRAFRHNDVDHARSAARPNIARRHRARADRHRRRVLDGRRPRAAARALARWRSGYDAWLMIDDAHGLGVLGGGRGSTFAHGAPADIPLQMGTLSKAIGGYGGYLCASHAVIDLMRNRARTLIYSTGLPPADGRGGDRRARPDRARARLRGAAARQGEGLRPRAPDLPEADEPDRARRDRRGRGGARRLAAAGGAGLPGRRRSGRRPCRTAPRGCASPSRPSIPTPRSSASPTVVRDRILARAA